MEEKDNSIIFRSYNLENDDRCKTIVKIESDYMDKLGIKEGDIVKVTGKDSAMAFCFSLNKEELEKAESQDLPIEYLNPDHEEIEYPRVIMSSPVHCNACPSRRLRLVKLEKLTTRDFKNQIPEANIVTLGTMKFAENAMPGYKDNIDFSFLFGQIVKKQERVNTSFFPDFAQKHQRTSRGGRSHPPNFSSIIINVKPENHNFWLVTKNTKFEFQDIPMDEFKGKKALITGGTKGLGLSTAKLLSKKGAEVFLTYRADHTAAKEAQDIIKSQGGKSSIIQCDLSENGAVERLFNQLELKTKDLDFYVHNAAATSFKPLCEQVKQQDPKSQVQDHQGVHFEPTA